MKDRNEQMVTYWIKEPVVDRLTDKGVTVFFKGGKLCSKNFHIINGEFALYILSKLATA